MFKCEYNISRSGYCHKDPFSDRNAGTNKYNITFLQI